ncbi:MAG: hypothetical protein Q9163_001066 [Psora crenata]
MEEVAPLVLGGGESQWVFDTTTPTDECDEDEPNYEPPVEVSKVNAAITTGDLATVKAVFESDWLEKSQDDRIDINRFASSLAATIMHDHVSVAAYLLSHGVRMNISHFKLAVERKSYSILQLFLDSGWDINEPINWFTPPPLMLALNDEKLVMWFLSHGADPNAECGLDITPLSIAVLEAPFAIIRLLFHYGGSIKHGQLLHYAVKRDTSDRIDVLEFIISKGPSINSIMYQNRLDCYNQQKLFGIGTPLHEAAEDGKLDIVEILLSKGADPLIKDARGMLALERAQLAGHSVVVGHLLPLSVPSWIPPQLH